MRIKVKYSETYDRVAETQVPDQDFLDWLNEMYREEPFASLDLARTRLSEEDFAGHLREYLEDGSESDWAVARELDPFANVYDREIDKVEVL